MWKRILLVAGLTALLFSWWSHRSVGREEGVLAPMAPAQMRLVGLRPFERGDYLLTPLARFDVEARVLGVKRYLLDREAALAPYDLALGWGRMSDSSILRDFEISQSNRFYHWTTKHPPIPHQEIVRSSANMHIIPADDLVMSTLQRVRPGHLVSLKGYLVVAKAKDGFVWLSSTTRDDTGYGACEVVWVDQIAYR